VDPDPRSRFGPEGSGINWPPGSGSGAVILLLRIQEPYVKNLKKFQKKVPSGSAWASWIRIRIRIEIKSWIRIRVETNADPQHCLQHWHIQERNRTLFVTNKVSSLMRLSRSKF
jgi:hypothetical protein